MDNLIQLRDILTAAAEGDDDRLRSLSEEDSSLLDLVNEEGASPLMYAATNGRETTVRFLLRNNVSVDKTNKYDWTALQQVSGVTALPNTPTVLLGLTMYCNSIKIHALDPVYLPILIALPPQEYYY